MKLTLTEDQQYDIILKTLKRDLKNVEDELDELAGNTQPHYSDYKKQCNKQIKMLKRAINFYSVVDEYENV